MTGIFKTRGADNRKIYLKKDALNAGHITLMIESGDGGESMAISLDPHNANILAGEIERLAVDSFAADLAVVA